jgi:hypothetical protein
MFWRNGSNARDSGCIYNQFLILLISQNVLYFNIELPQETKKFKTVDTTWRHTMQQAKQI